MFKLLLFLFIVKIYAQTAQTLRDEHQKKHRKVELKESNSEEESESHR